MAEVIARKSVITEYIADTSNLENANARASRSTKSVGDIITDTTQKAKEGYKGLGNEGTKSITALDAASGKLTKTLGLLAKYFVGLFALQKIIGFLTDASKASTEFNQAVSELSAITGATGKDLEFYADAARQIGASTTLSASQAVEAFKLIGSARPELLKNKEALAAVTAEAVTLAEAARIDMPTAAAALAGALNQFQLPSEDAARVINALAAGSKEGAASIPQITQAIDKFGVAAAASNISFEESVGLVETLAEFSIQGAEAGTSLRNVLTRLSTAKGLPKEALDQLQRFGVDTNILTDSTLSLEDRLREFSKIAGDSTALVKVFGAENAIAGQVVLQNVDKFTQYTKAVTGTSTALEQAKTNTDNFAGEQAALSSAFESVKIAIGSFLEQALRPLTRGLTTLIIGLSQIPSFIRENRSAIIALIGALVAFNGQAIAAAASSLRLAAAEKGRLILTKAITAAQSLQNAVFNASPLGRIIQLVSLLAAGFAILYQRSETVRAGLAGVIEVGREIGRIFVEVLSAFGDGFSDIMEGNIIEGVKKIGAAVVRTNPIGLIATEGKRLAGAFNTGFEDRKEQERLNKIANDKGEQVAENLQAGVVETIKELAPVVRKEMLSQLEKLRQDAEKAFKKLTFLEVGTVAFEQQAQAIRNITRELEVYEGTIKQALGPQTVEPIAKRFIDRVTLLEGRLTQLRQAAREAFVDGNQEWVDDLDRSIAQVESEILAFRANYGEGGAIDQIMGLGKQAKKAREAGIQSAFESLRKTIPPATVQESAVEKEKRLNEQRIQQLGDLKEAATDTFSALSSLNNQQLEEIQTLISAQSDRVTRYERLAETGSARQLEIEEERLTKLQAIQAKAQQQQRQLAQAQIATSQAVTAAEAVKAITQAFAQGGPLGILTGVATSAALALAIASTIKSVSGAFSNLPAFREGTESVRGPGNGRSDSILARVSRGERITDAVTNGKIAKAANGIFPNHLLPEAVQAYMGMPALSAGLAQMASVTDRGLSRLTEEVAGLRKEQKETRIFFGIRDRQLAAMVSQYETRDRWMRG